MERFDDHRLWDLEGAADKWAEEPNASAYGLARALAKSFLDAKTEDRLTALFTILLESVEGSSEKFNCCY